MGASNPYPPVNQPVAKDNPFQRRLSDLAFQAEHSLHRLAIDRMCHRQQRVRLPVWFCPLVRSALVIDERNALGDQSSGTGMPDGCNKIACANLPKAGMRVSAAVIWPASSA